MFSGRGGSFGGRGAAQAVTSGAMIYESTLSGVLTAKARAITLTIKGNTLKTLLIHAQIINADNALYTDPSLKYNGTALTVNRINNPVGGPIAYDTRTFEMYGGPLAKTMTDVWFLCNVRSGSLKLAEIEGQVFAENDTKIQDIWGSAYLGGGDRSTEITEIKIDSNHTDAMNVNTNWQVFTASED